jgi:hypothetical protein
MVQHQRKVQAVQVVKVERLVHLEQVELRRHRVVLVQVGRLVLMELQAQVEQRQRQELMPQTERQGLTELLVRGVL